MFQQHSCALFCEGLCEDATVSVPSCRCSRVVGLAGPSSCPSLLPLPSHGASVSSLANGFCHFYSQLSAMDVSVRTTMKGAAKCDKHCELQNSVNRQGLERILCFWDIPESMPASVSMLCCSSSTAIWHCRCECLCLKMRVSAPEASNRQDYATTASLLSISVCPMLAVRVVAASCSLCGFGSFRCQAPTT